MQPHPDRVMEQSRVRVWPGVALAVLLVMLRLVMPAVAPDAAILGVPVPMIGILGGAICAVAIVIWWLFFSRVRWTDRLLILAVSAAAFGAVWLVVDRSVSNGMMGMMYVVFALPLAAIGLAAGAAAARNATGGRRRIIVPAAVLIACSLMAVVRTGGISGDGISDLHWRWTPTPEQRLLAAAPAPLEPLETSGAKSTALPAPVASAAPVTPAAPAPVAPVPAAPAAPAAQPHPPHPHLLHPWHLPHLSHPLLGGLASGARIATAS